jgi:group I intron endonuclease
MPNNNLKNTGIYCIENKTNGKKYIGQAFDIQRRLDDHRRRLVKGKDTSPALQNAINKYGWDNFRCYTLEVCDASEMDGREVFYISKYGTNKKDCGYNISLGGGNGMLGHKFPPEFGRKLSEMKKGMKIPEEQREKMKKARSRLFFSEETQEKIPASWAGENHWMWGKKHKKETIEKMRKSHGGTNAWQFGKKSKNASSKYFGVHLLDKRDKSKGWVADIKILGKLKYIGFSKSEIEAARMYDAYVIENNLPNPLNFPEEQ